MAEEEDENQEDKERADGKPGPDEKYCKNCGEIIDEEAEICPECGVRVKKPGENKINVNVENQNQVETNNVQSQNGFQDLQGNKSKVVAALLAFFLGWIGGHKLYLGQPGRALLYALFFWTWIPLIVSWIQGIAYLLMSEKRFAQKFG